MKLFSTLTNRIFVTSAALTLLCISTAIYVVNRRVTAAAEDDLRRELVQAGVLVDQQRANVSDLFAVFARTVADLPKLKAAVATDDPPTVQPIAAEYARTVQASLFLVTNRSRQVLAQRLDSGRPVAVPRPPLDGALAGHETAAFWPSPDGVLQVVTVPIAAGASPPEIVGTLSLGFLLDEALAERFKVQTGSEIAFATPSRVVAATLPGPDRLALAGLTARPGIGRVHTATGDYLALVRPLSSPRPPSLLGLQAGAPAPAAVAASDAPPVAIILRSRTERLRLLQPIRAALLGTGALAMVLAVLLSYAVARTVTRPLAAITAAMKEMTRTGNLDHRIAGSSSRWVDEDARVLANTFNTLTASIARFQREAAERERLSALGRLSTVIAHEVRNPLMIIKASLRPLHSDHPSPGEVREAAADIDEEVARLNRLVDDVLDFARPLRFTLGPTDVNAVCTQSAEAAARDATRVEVGLALDATLRPLVTDAERLRSVLINLLVNARDAVSARKGPAPEGPAVVVATHKLDEGRVAIEVRDRGVGIEPANLGRIFEPYFTTKRAGTGLGLAIARNVVEGLGGSVEVTSRPGSGTRVRIELRDAEAPRPSETSHDIQP